MSIAAGRERVVAINKELRKEWEEACRPLQDERPEAMELYEERKLQARNTLIEFRKQHQAELPAPDHSYAATHVIATALRASSRWSSWLAEKLDSRISGKTLLH